MLDVISVESFFTETVEEIYTELERRLSLLQKPAPITSHGIRASRWERQGVIVLSETQTTRALSRDLQGFLEEWRDDDVQIWTRVRLSESIVRTLRQLEKDGVIRYRCFLVGPQKNQDVGEPKELERIVKLSQNKNLRAEWINGSKAFGFVENMIKSRYGLNYPVEILPKVTSADTDPVETPLSVIMRRYYSKIKGRQIHWYPKMYVHKAMDEEKWGVDPMPKAKQGSVKRHVLVTGTGRSGTTYFSDLLTLLGLDVGHQRNGKDGCSGAEFSVDHYWYPWFPVYGGGDCANVGERRSDYDYAHVLHIVRHPLWCIPSLMRNYPAINPEFWADNGTMDPKAMDASSIYRNAAMYYGINEVIHESGQAEYVCQLEKIHEHWDTLMDILDMHGTPDPVLPPTNKAVGWGQYEPLTWNELENSVGSVLANSIRAQAKRYGYD